MTVVDLEGPSPDPLVLCCGRAQILLYCAVGGLAGYAGHVGYPTMSNVDSSCFVREIDEFGGPETPRGGSGGPPIYGQDKRIWPNSGCFDRPTIQMNTPLSDRKSGTK